MLKMRGFSLLAVIVVILASSVRLASQTSADLFGEGRIPEIRLTIREPNWSAMLDSLKIYGEEMIVASAEIDGVKYPNTGVRYRGQGSYTYKGARNPFQIRLDYVHPDQNHAGLKSFVLSNSLRDPSLLREYMGFAIARDYMVAPRANYARLYINGKYQGLYVLIEPIDRSFLDRTLPGAWTHLFKCTPDERVKTTAAGCLKNTYCNLEYQKDAGCYPANYELKQGQGHQDLVELIRILNKEPKEIEKVLDVDATLWMLAYNNVIVNLGSYSGRYSQNYYLVRGANGKFIPVVWDLNLAFGSYKNTGIGSDLSLKDLEKLDPFLHAGNATKPLIKALLSNDLYRKIYVSHMKQIVKDHFREDKFAARSKKLHDLIRSAVVEDKAFGYTPDEFTKSLANTTGTRSRIPGIVAFMQARSEFIWKNELFRAQTPVVAKVDLARRGQYAQEKIGEFTFDVTTAKGAKRVWLYYRFSGETDFRSMPMVLSTKENSQPGEAVFSLTVSPSAPEVHGMEYYILLENPAGVTFYPENYRKEPAKADLKELN